MIPSRFNLIRTTKEMMPRNQDAVVKSNKTMLLFLLFGICFILLIPVVISSLRIGYETLSLCYEIAIALFLCMLLLYRLRVFDRKPHVGLYIGFTVVFSLTIYLSVIGSPMHRASIILGTFCIIPLCIIDYFWRISSFMTLFYVIHTVLSFHFKGSVLGLDDAVNCICYLFFGLFVGVIMQQARLNSYDLARRLTLERETDVLTGLKNRRKLFELLAEMEQGKTQRPSGAFMLDIDYFKAYNDQHGHAAGDHYLQAFGQLLSSFEQTENIRFYRYGGEEFSAFAWGYDVPALGDIAQRLCRAVAALADPHGGRTISIGYTDCTVSPDAGYESLLAQADQAVYEAKARGRNTTVCFQQI